MRTHLRAALPPALGAAANRPTDPAAGKRVRKVDRTAVREALPATDVSGSSLAEREATKVAQLLGLGSVGLDDDFFELGGDSRPRSSSCVWAEQNAGRSVETSALFGHPTPRELAAHVGRADATG